MLTAAALTSGVSVAKRPMTLLTAWIAEIWRPTVAAVPTAHVCDVNCDILLRVERDVKRHSRRVDERAKLAIQISHLMNVCL